MGSVPGKSAGGSDAAGTETNSAAGPLAVSAPAADAAPQVAGADAVQASALAPTAATLDTAAASHPQQAEQRLVTPDAAAQPQVESVASTESAGLATASAPQSAAPAVSARSAAEDSTAGASRPNEATRQGAAAGSVLVSSTEVRQPAGPGQVHGNTADTQCCALFPQAVVCWSHVAWCDGLLAVHNTKAKALRLPHEQQRCTQLGRQDPRRS